MRSEHKTREETFSLSYLYSRSLGSDRDNVLYGASCHAGARLFRSPGVSLVLHPICRGFSHDWVARSAHAFLQTWGPTPCLVLQPSRLAGHPRDHPVWYWRRSTKSSAYRHISLSLPLRSISVSSFLQAPLHCAAISHHFQTFQTGSGLFYDECL